MTTEQWITLVGTILGNGFLMTIILLVKGKLDGSERDRRLMTRVEAWKAVRDDPVLGPVFHQSVLAEVAPTSDDEGDENVDEADESPSTTVRRSRRMFAILKVLVGAFIALTVVLLARTVFWPESSRLLVTDRVFDLGCAITILVLIYAWRRASTREARALDVGERAADIMELAVEHLDGATDFIVSRGLRTEYKQFVADSRSTSDADGEPDEEGGTDEAKDDSK